MSQNAQDGTTTGDPVPIGYYDQALNKAGVQQTWHSLKFAAVKERCGDFEQHLDIACGPGSFLGLLSRGRSVGVDLEEQQLSYARDQYTHHNNIDGFITARCEQLPFAQHSFDLITCIELIEHLPQSVTEKLFIEIARVIRPGGRLILTTPNYRSFWPVLEYLISVYGPVDYTKEHISHYHRHKLTKLLSQSMRREPKVNTFQALAPFLAPLGQSVSSRMARIENRLLERCGGCLLLAEVKF